MEDVIIKYSTDTSDLVAARRELGLLDGAQEDLVAQFAQLNTQIAKQAQALAQIAKEAAGGTKAAKDEEAQVLKVAKALADQATAQARLQAAAANAQKAQTAAEREKEKASQDAAKEADRLAQIELKNAQAEEAAARRAATAEQAKQRAATAAAVAEQRAASAAQKAADDETKAQGRLGSMLAKINQLKAQKLTLTDDGAIAKINREIEELQDSYDKLDKVGTKATKNVGEETGFLGKALGEIGPLIAGAFAVDKLVEYAGKIIEVTANYQKYQAVLTNTLGSAQEADEVLASIQDFAAKTPFSVQQLTDAYVKLANQGFKPTNDQLRQLGDLASSTGKDFDQLAEAILDAQTGEFERLKEFGIQASKNGDKVTFTFKEQKTTVDASASSIQKYILGLGDLKGVSGSMAAVSETLTGQISNLGDSLDQLFLAIGQKGSPILKYFITDLSNSAQAVTQLINGNDKYIQAQIKQAAAIKPLVERYQELQRQGKLSADQQAEQARLFDVLARAVPTAVTGFDSYGKAVSLSTTKVNEFVAAQEAVAKSRTLDQLTVQRQRYAEIEAAIKGATNALSNRNAGGDIVKTVFSSFGDDAQEAANEVKLTAGEVAALQKRLADLRGERLDVGQQIVALKGLGTAAKEVQKDLYNIFGDFSPDVDYFGELLGLIPKVEAKIKSAKESLAGLNSEKEIAAQERYITGLEKELKRLNDLGTVYGALGRVQKKLSDEEAKRGEYSEAELARSNRRVKAYNEEIKRLNELGLATGLVGQIQREMSKITDSIPDLKIGADVTKAYEKLDQLQARLDALRPPKFELPNIADFGSVLEKQVQDALNYRKQVETEQSTFLKGQQLEELQGLRKSLNDGTITRAQYAVQVEKLAQKTSKNLIQNELDTVNGQLKVQDLSNDQRNELEAKRVELQKALYDQDTENYIAAQQKKSDIENELRTQLLQAGTELVNQLFANEAQALADKLAALQQAHDYEIGLAGNTAGAKGKIDEAYAAKENQIRREQNELARKQAIFQKSLAIAQIAVNTAVGISKVIAEVPKVDFGISTGILIAAYIALGAIQAATVIAQPVAKFAKGTDWVKGGQPGKDSVAALLMPGERVVTTDVNRDYYGSLSAIHRREVPPKILAQFVLDYKRFGAFNPPPVQHSLAVAGSAIGDQAFQEKLLGALADRPVEKHVYDDLGHRRYTERQGSRQESLNRRYSFGD